MKVSYKKISVFLVAVIMLILVGCSPVDTSSGEENESKSDKYEDVSVPEITSEDSVMPTFFDISHYNVENYAEIYLGKDFNLKATYAGSEIEVPTTYKKMVAKGFSIPETNEYSEKSIVLAGKNLKADFVNEYGNKITAVFHNSSNSSVELKKCKIVKFIIAGNSLLSEDSKYGQFFVNGVTNGSAITDVIEYLGAPSHFYCEGNGQYYLDYFVSKEDMRSGITVYIDTNEDNVTAIEFSNYD